MMGNIITHGASLLPNFFKRNMQILNTYAILANTNPTWPFQENSLPQMIQEQT